MTRRTRPLWTRQSEAITPTSTPLNIGELTREQLIAKLLDYKRQLAAERRRNGRIEALLVRVLDETETKMQDARTAFVATLAAGLVPKEAQ
jgi:hypothetical protein